MSNWCLVDNLKGRKWRTDIKTDKFIQQVFTKLTLYIVTGLAAKELQTILHFRSLEG
jgi:hypothetical protein